ncbi:GLPGLI family protein [Elizabethkingia meningoseptica]|uniref:GLPGLI family protein n=1 Tax=Elizabethkingia meningoseptica TaxID=238 RepID=UPI003891D02A
MKKLLTVLLIAFFLFTNAQNSQQIANRFFYELTFKPKKDSAKTDKKVTILDIISRKSVYQDYTLPSQDSIMKIQIEKMKKSGNVFQDVNKILKSPKFTYKIIKFYPDMKLQYVDRIGVNLFSYNDQLKLKWDILPEKQKIGIYNTQKATTEFGGRKWIAWFSSDIPFQDGPYKFQGLPGLIIKIEDTEKNYVWLLSGNKKIIDYDETYSDNLVATIGMMKNTITPTSKEKFQKLYKVYITDPLAETRQYMTPEYMNMIMPGTNETIGNIIKKEEKRLKESFKANDNFIEKD